MANKHYDIGYLQDTGKVLKDLKERSYHSFTSVSDGVIIDLGCGTGNDVIQMAGLLGDHVKLVGIDHDPVMLEHAKAADGASGVDFILSEAYPIPFENEAVSGLRAERLIQHLTNAGQVIQEIHRVLKPGHPLTIIETDWRSLSFYSEYAEIEKKVNTYLTEIKVNNGAAAKKLTGYLENSRFREIKLEIHPFVINSLKGANEYFWIERIVKEAADKNYITEEEYSSFYSSLEQADNKGYFSCSINLVMVSCIK